MTTVDTTACCGAHPLPALTALVEAAAASRDELVALAAEIAPHAEALRSLAERYWTHREPLVRLSRAALHELESHLPSREVRARSAVSTIVDALAGEPIWDLLNGVQVHLDEVLNDREIELDTAILDRGRA